MDRRERPPLTDAQLAVIRERMPDFDEARFAVFVDDFETGLLRVAEREGGVTEQVLRLTFAEAFTPGTTSVPPVEVERRTGLEADAVLAIMQSAFHEAAVSAHERPHN